ncbi:Arv1-like family-domain-containing protein [Aspergillus pseudodeflectus]|uniref:Protein ARV n=1 Tax=Aspergillus pseudodeflectus TaxID=176178 RepID=A0ABR4KYY4_9EURO
MPICIECSYPVSHLYSAYSRADDRSLGKGVRLTQCPRCKRFADKYVEHDFVVIFIDLVLIKPQVYRHLLFNRLEGDEHKFDRSIIRLGVLLLLFDVYLTWARIEKSPSLESTFLSRAPIIVQYLFFLTLNALATLAHHLTVRLLASFLTLPNSKQPTDSPLSQPTDVPASDPSTPVLPTFPQPQAPGSASQSPSKIASQAPSQDFQSTVGNTSTNTSTNGTSSGNGSTNGVTNENQRPNQPSSPRDSFCGLPPPLHRTSTAPAQSLQPLAPPSQASPTAISTALFVSSCAKLFPILLVIWGPDGSGSFDSRSSASSSSAGVGSAPHPNLAQHASGGGITPAALAGSSSSSSTQSHSSSSSTSSSSFSSSLFETLLHLIPSALPASYVANIIEIASSLFTLGATDTHLVLLSNIEALYILLGCGYFRAMALAVSGLVARWTVQRVILGVVGVG